MSKALKTYGGVIFFYSIVIMGVLLLLMKNTTVNNYTDNTKSAEYNITIAYNN